MLVDDIERATFADTEAWTPNKNNTRKQSLHNVTSLSAEELVDYVTNSTLFQAMLNELEARGVNTENILTLYTTDDAFHQ